jgi:plasmid stability protein
MSDEIVKLTVRLPAELHRALRERAAEYRVSLNQAVIDTLSEQISKEEAEEDIGKRFDRVLREKGLMANTSWVDDFLPGVEPATLEEAREWLKDVPLSDWIIEDRGPR